jgi:uncharacterized protein (DUF1330 family)
MPPVRSSSWTADWSTTFRTRSDLRGNRLAADGPGASAYVEQIPAYAVGYLRDVAFGDDVIRYMREIDATLEPFGGEFIVHGGHIEAIEGDWDGALVIIRFPNRTSAMAWYGSADYQRILRLRVQNSRSMAAIVDGVKAGHTGSAKVDELLAR